MENPLISIIVATYNSSHLLRYSIQSVLDSDYSKWEMIVVGDCCTDDTDKVVAGFGDSRIFFTNLEENSGQQAKPTNVAFSYAKGEYITFLNQDDMFFRSHLSNCVAEMLAFQPEFMVVPGIVILPTTQEELVANRYEAEIYAVHPRGKFSPLLSSIASTWFIHKSVIEKIGFWKMEKETFVTPSREWIFRAHLRGLQFHFPKKPGVLVLFSAERKGSYKKKFSFEHDFFFNRLNDPELKVNLLEKAAVKSSSEFNHLTLREPYKLIRRTLAFLLHQLLAKLRIHPSSFRLYLKWGKRGELIARLKKKAETPD